jgi:membrane-associated protease RseP (regulator of RpoE activity)
MPVVIACPSCKQKLKAPDAAIGKAVKCPGCGSAIKVNAPDAPEPAPAPAAAQRQAAAAAKTPAPRRDEPEEDFDDEPRRGKGRPAPEEEDEGPRKPTAYLGVGFDPETTDLEITDVYEKMPAAKAGLKVGDVITRLDGKKVKERKDLADFLSKKKPGDTIGVEIKGDDEEIEVKLGKRPE